MSLLFCDSFNHYVSAELTRKYTFVNASYASIDAFGRNGNGLKISGGATSSLNALYKTLEGSHSTLIVGFAMYPTHTGNIITTNYFFNYRSTGALQMGLRLNADNTIGIINPSNTLINSSSVSLAINQWHYIEFKVTFGASGSYDLRINGISRASGSSVNTGVSSNGLYFYINPNPSATSLTYYVSDLVVLSGDATAPNNFLGDVKVGALRPVADSAVNNDWTVVGSASKYDAVNDLTSDDDSSYILSSTPTHRQTFDFEDISGNPSILGLQVVVTARKEVSGDHNLTALSRLGGTDYTHSGVGALTTSYAHYTFPMGTNPATSGAWNVADINNGEFGVELLS